MAKTDKSKEKKKNKRRAVLNYLAVLCSILLLALIALVVVNIIANQSFEVSFYEIQSEKVSDLIRVVELSDLHNAEFGEKNSELVEKIETLHPDLIFFCGDMINKHDTDYSVLFELSDQLAEIAPIYACFGNHDYTTYLVDDREMKDKMRAHNINILSNQAEMVKVKNTTIQLIAISEGIDQFDIETNTCKKFLQGLAPTNNLRICLTHYPELFKEKLLNWGIDIAFTGHAHGGHIRLPYIGGLYSNGEGFLPKFTSGVQTVADGTRVVISRGLGNHNPIPRINNKPELVVVDINWY